MCSYFVVAGLGIASFVMPWAYRASPEAASAAAFAGVMYVVHYLLEAALAWHGTVTMHAWRADEVVKHHLTVGLVLMPACLACALYIPGEWQAMLESHPTSSRGHLERERDGVQRGSLRAALLLAAADRRRAVDPMGAVLLHARGIAAERANDAGRLRARCVHATPSLA